MPIDYIAESEKYRPCVVRTLLVGEAPPPAGRAYFYLPQDLANGRPVAADNSLPATIFHHYFGMRPATAHEYHAFLLALKDQGVFLVDIWDGPLAVRGSPDGERKIISEIPNLRGRLSLRGITVSQSVMIFLLARNTYVKHIRQEFPSAARTSWKAFRTNPQPVPLLPYARS